MLAWDVALHTDHRLAAVAMFSGARITADAWQSRYETRRGMPAFISHGRSDRDLDFFATQAFKDDLVAAGVRVEWCPFDGGHEIPLPALRAFKKFLKEL
jgi:phospholipase/carboxylesterase